MPVVAGRPEPVLISLVPHTHWDREWYLPFEGFLAQLVEMMDGLIELSRADPPLPHFHLDGQAALIDDYLAVRPEREPDVRRLAREGRISVGPWFTQMDEFLVSGESLIRNLEWGMARARDLEAEPPVAGYLPDQFGHIGQMPQLLRRAGLERAVVWRGVPSAVDRTVFRWESPDGTAVLAEYLPFGYGVGAALSGCADPEGLAVALRQAASLLAPMSPFPRLLVMVGADHHRPPARLPKLLQEVGRAGDEIRAEICSLSSHLRSEPPAGDLPVWRGELRSSARAHLLPGVYSTRVHQKRDRARVEALVERYAEPLAALTPGFPWPEGELEEVWRLLLWNGAHDSVCGCSVDEVARAVDARHRRASEVAGAVARRALEALASLVGPGGRLRFNPSPFERDGVPGLGWAVGGPRPPRAGRVPVAVEGEAIVAGDLRLRLVDEEDQGDLYTFCPAGPGPVGPTSITVGRSGQVRARFERCLVRLRILARPGEPFLRVEGSVANRAPDHRLRLHVGLAGPALGSTAVSPFELVDRPLTSEGGTEAPSPTWPARGAVLAGGTAVVEEGVFEYEVCPEPPELAVTLLRAVGTISRPTLATRPWPAGPDLPTPEAQMIGEVPFSLAALPRAARADLLPAWERFALPLLEARAPGGGPLPARGSLLEVEGAELSAVRVAEGGRLEVRVWNPSTVAVEARVGGRRLRLGPARIEDVVLPRPDPDFRYPRS